MGTESGREVSRLHADAHRALAESRRNLGAGAFPPGSQGREEIVGIVWSAVRDYFDGEDEAFTWLKSVEAGELLAWIGLPQSAFCARLKETCSNPVIREAIRPVMHRHDIAMGMMAGLSS